ncbi:olfactory receptor 7C1-like [Pomacea canaliculata]|uniref:olfactory receptor 7C1-like n=1 Tax=Pomacea canaliculata TaxID=400727 RepID=UPI000D72E5A5|nr:olfactory receptor 7C1-like [Pomacea canaliculata]
MLDNVTEEQESWLSLSDVSVIFLVVYIVMKGVIFGGNLLTVVTICVDSALHTPAYIFTALLAEADLLVGLSGVYDMLVLAAPSFLPLLSCPVNFLVIAAIVQAAQCTVLIALDRTLAIKYPCTIPCG